MHHAHSFTVYSIMLSFMAATLGQAALHLSAQKLGIACLKHKKKSSRYAPLWLGNTCLCAYRPGMAVMGACRQSRACLVLSPAMISAPSKSATDNGVTKIDNRLPKDKLNLELAVLTVPERRVQLAGFLNCHQYCRNSAKLSRKSLPGACTCTHVENAWAKTVVR